MKEEKVKNIIRELEQIEQSLYELDANEESWDNKCALDESIRKISRVQSLLRDIL